MKTLKGKFIALFVCFILVSVFAGFFVINTISKQEADLVVMNLAGRRLTKNSSVPAHHHFLSCASICCLRIR